MSAQHTPGPTESQIDEAAHNYADSFDPNISDTVYEAFCQGTEWYGNQVSELIAPAPLLKEEVETLKTAIREALQADNQYSFFLNGYANGSASISEVENASEERGKAFSRLFDLTKI